MHMHAPMSYLCSLYHIWKRLFHLCIKEHYQRLSSASWSSQHSILLEFEVVASFCIIIDGINCLCEFSPGVKCTVSHRIGPQMRWPSLHASAKLVHPDFHRMLEKGRWEGGNKNTVGWAITMQTGEDNAGR